MFGQGVARGLGAVLSVPVRAASAGVQVAAATAGAVAGFAGSAALLGGSAAALAGETLISAVPGGRTAARAVAGVALEAVGGEPARRGSRHGRRHWIEVRGLAGPDADAIAEEVLEAVRAVPGVLDAVVNRSVARVIVTVDAASPPRDLHAVVTDAERRARSQTAPRHRPLTLPADDTVVATRLLAALAAATGLSLSVAGTVLKLPGLPAFVSVAPTLADQIPAVRHTLVRRLGHEGTDLLFSLIHATNNILTVSPTAAAGEAVTRALLAEEAWRARQAWHRHEPTLAEQCPEGREPAPGRTVFSDGPGEEYANRAGWIGLSAAAVIGALSRNATVAGAAALVSAPKPTRAAREAFGCAMTRGLTTRHDTVVIRPRALRALDRIEVIVIDPRVLYTDELTVTRVRGVGRSGSAPASDRDGTAWPTSRAPASRWAKRWSARCATRWPPPSSARPGAAARGWSRSATMGCDHWARVSTRYIDARRIDALGIGSRNRSTTHSPPRSPACVSTVRPSCC